VICLLDTSALLAHFRAESGASRVQAIFDDLESSILVASITITEFSRRMRELGATHGEINEALHGYKRRLSEVVATDRAIAQAAFTLGLRASARLPMAGTLIDAAAANRGAILVHRDPHFSALPPGALEQEML